MPRSARATLAATHSMAHPARTGPCGLASSSMEALSATRPSASQTWVLTEEELKGQSKERPVWARGKRMELGVRPHWVRWRSHHRRLLHREHGIRLGLEKSPLLLCGPGPRAQGRGRGLWELVSLARPSRGLGVIRNAERRVIA